VTPQTIQHGLNPYTQDCRGINLLAMLSSTASVYGLMHQSSANQGLASLQLALKNKLNCHLSDQVTFWSPHWINYQLEDLHFEET